MKKIKYILLVLLPLNVFAETTVNKDFTSSLRKFTDVYTENSGLLKADTVATYLQLRTGATQTAKWESYGVLRFGADTRTVLGSNDQVYNDNYLFMGVGFDYLGLFPGVRLVGQIGASEDITKKINLGGFDGRAGFMSYHEINKGITPIYGEFYSEGIYVHRYRNFLTSIQMRILYDLKTWRLSEGGAKNLVISPMANLVLSGDSSGQDYNRFAEARLGARIALRAPITFILNPYYVVGSRWERPTDFPNYQDFRILLVAAANF